MGLFDDFTNFMNEAQSLKKEVTQLGSDVVKELVSEANGMKKTVVDTKDEITTTAKDLSNTVKSSVSLASDDQADQSQSSSMSE